MSEKSILTSVSPAEADAMADILNRLRQDPEWGNRQDGLTLPLSNGGQIEVRKHEGSLHGVVVIFPSDGE